MSVLYITEYTSILSDRIQIPLEPELKSQTVAISASHAESAAFTDTTRFVRIETDVICSIVFGANPVATTSNRRLAADSVEYYAVPQGQAFKVSVISNT